MPFFAKKRNVIPGFGLTLGYTVLYLSLVVLIPLSTVLLNTAELSWEAFLETVTAPRVLASYRLTFGLTLAATLMNGLFGVLTAWVLVRYSLPGKRLIDAMVDLPFALPTAVAGITLATLPGDGSEELLRDTGSRLPIPLWAYSWP
jgi:sulfate transport system permease protein